MKGKLVILSIVLLGSIAFVYAGQKGGILFPSMKPEKGTYAKPAGKIGAKPASPWSVSTVAAAVDGKPLPGKVMSVTGEIIDYSCYMQVGKHGEKHRDCGQKCLKAGQPMGILAKDGTMYLLMDEEHNPRRDGMTNLRAACIENMARIVTVTGTYSEVAGTKAIFVQGFLKK